ncbi:hypothetical protein [Gluconobacter wancherniae]|nr:hypothetical protein [Gluconobacter wancherniae]
MSVRMALLTELDDDASPSEIAPVRQSQRVKSAWNNVLTLLAVR